jgi:hypothetical protein
MAALASMFALVSPPAGTGVPPGQVCPPPAIRQ